MKRKLQTLREQAELTAGDREAAGILEEQIGVLEAEDKAAASAAAKKGAAAAGGGSKKPRRKQGAESAGKVFSGTAAGRQARDAAPFAVNEPEVKSRPWSGRLSAGDFVGGALAGVDVARQLAQRVWTAGGSWAF